MKSFLKICLITAICFNGRIIGSPCPSQHDSYRMGKELFESGQYLLSAFHFSLVSASDCDSNLRRAGMFNYALAMNELGEKREVYRIYERMHQQEKDGLTNALKMLTALIDPKVTESLPDLDKGRLYLWENRENKKRFESLLNGLDISTPKKNEWLSIQAQLESSSARSPLIAGVLSAVLPGAGQAYAGAWQSAIVSLVLNSLFAASTIQLIDRDLWAPAAASGLVFSVVYIGNIVNATRAANQRNLSESLPFELKLKNALFPELSLK